MEYGKPTTTQQDVANGEPHGANTQQNNTSSEVVEGVAGFIGLATTAQTGVDAAIKHGTTAAEKAAEAGTKTSAIWKRAGIIGAVASGASAIKNYEAGNISGVHAFTQVVIAGIGVGIPALGFALSFRLV